MYSFSVGTKSAEKENHTPHTRKVIYRFFFGLMDSPVERGEGRVVEFCWGWTRGRARALQKPFYDQDEWQHGNELLWASVAQLTVR